MNRGFLLLQVSQLWSVTFALLLLGAARSGVEDGVSAERYRANTESKPRPRPVKIKSTGVEEMFREKV